MKEYCKRCSLPLREWEWAGEGWCEMCDEKQQTEMVMCMSLRECNVLTQMQQRQINVQEQSFRWSNAKYDQCSVSVLPPQHKGGDAIMFCYAYRVDKASMALDVHEQRLKIGPRGGIRDITPRRPS